MKRFIYFLFAAATLIMTMAACSKDDEDALPDDGDIWDISPTAVFIHIVDEEGNNLLDPTVVGNWIGEPMWMLYRDKAYDVAWTKEEMSTPTRAIMPHFYGAVWNGVWTDKHYSIRFGDFHGDSNRTYDLTFGITAINTVFEFEYSHRLLWEDKKPKFEDYITYKGKKIEGSTLTLVLPKK